MYDRYPEGREEDLEDYSDYEDDDDSEEKMTVEMFDQMEKEIEEKDAKQLEVRRQLKLKILEQRKLQQEKDTKKKKKAKGSKGSSSSSSSRERNPAEEFFLGKKGGKDGENDEDEVDDGLGGGGLFGRKGKKKKKKEDPLECVSAHMVHENDPDYLFFDPYSTIFWWNNTKFTSPNELEPVAGLHRDYFPGEAAALRLAHDKTDLEIGLDEAIELDENELKEEPESNVPYDPIAAYFRRHTRTYFEEMSRFHDYEQLENELNLENIKQVHDEELVIDKEKLRSEALKAAREKEIGRLKGVPDYWPEQIGFTSTYDYTRLGAAVDFSKLPTGTYENTSYYQQIKAEQLAHEEDRKIRKRLKQKGVNKREAKVLLRELDRIIRSNGSEIVFRIAIKNVLTVVDRDYYFPDEYFILPANITSNTTAGSNTTTVPNPIDVALKTNTTTKLPKFFAYVTEFKPNNTIIDHVQAKNRMNELEKLYAAKMDYFASYYVTDYTDDRGDPVLPISDRFPESDKTIEKI